MDYTSGYVILDDHYNIFVQGGAAAVDHGTANLNTMWGAGNGTDKGWGQTGNLSTVSAGSTISATQWASLLNRMNTIADHTNSSITAITNPTTGDDIEAYAALSTNISTLWGNRGDAHASGTDITTNGTMSGTSSWQVSAIGTKTVSFSSNNAADYFFNAGGMIRISLSRSGGTANNKNTEWTDLLSKVGTIAITGGALIQSIAGTNYTGTTKVGGSGTANIHLTTTGWHDLTAGAGYTTVYRQYADTAPYTGNYIDISIRKDAAADAIDIRVRLFDTETDSDPVLDIVDGTLLCNVVVRPPSTTHISNTWGTPTMGASSWAYT